MEGVLREPRYARWNLHPDMVHGLLRADRAARLGALLPPLSPEQRISWLSELSGMFVQ